LAETGQWDGICVKGDNGLNGKNHNS